MPGEPVAAILLAGGRSSRLGSPKPLLRKDGTTLLERALGLLTTAGACPLVVVGSPERPLPDGVHRVREEPPFSGPAAGLAAGVAALPCSVTWVIVLACDVPEAGPAIDILLGVLAGPSASATEAVLAEPQGDRPQPLIAAYRIDALRQIFGRWDPRDRSMRALVEQLRTSTVVVPLDAVADIDTREDAAARGWSPRAGQ